MTFSSISCIEDLSPKETEKLTQILSRSPNLGLCPSWLQDQATHVSKLPSALRKPFSILPSLSLPLRFGKQKVCLCESHKALNPYLIRDIFLQLSAECTTHLARLILNPDLSYNLAVSLKRLQRINSLWMSPDLFRVMCTAFPYDSRFERVEGGCEACILATIGGNLQILSDLRATMIGRRKKRTASPGLLKLVEAWIHWTGRDDEILKGSDELGREILACRSKMQKERRAKKRFITDGNAVEEIERSPTMVGESSSDDTEISEKYDTEKDELFELYERDFENSVIDFYTNKFLSTTTVGRCDTLEGDMHPTFRDSIVFDAPSGTFLRRISEPELPKQRDSTWNGVYSAGLETPPLPKRYSYYSASVYSTDGFVLEPQAKNPFVSPQTRNFEKRAEAYRKLNGIAEESDSSESPRGSQGTQISRPRATVWDDFI
jgi:hypothetical protein